MSYFGVLLSAVALLVIADFTARAAVQDPVPLPRPNPHVTASAAKAGAPTQKKSVFQKLFGKKQKGPTGPSPFTPTQQTMLADISRYFNSFRTMRGEFRPSRPARRTVGRRLRNLKARQDSLSLQTSGQARCHIKRKQRCNSRQSGPDAGSLSSFEDAVASPPCQNH